MIGTKLKTLRNDKGLTQADVAKVLGVSRTTYTQYETGKSEPDLATVNRLAEFFGVSTDWLFGRTIVKTPIETTAASWDGEGDWTKEELEDIEQFKEFVKSKRDREQNK